MQENIFLLPVTSVLTSIYSHVQFVVKKSIMLYIVTIFNMILSTSFNFNFSHGNSQIYFVSLGKTHVSDMNPLALQLKLLRAHMESVLNALLREKTVMHALQLF
jgi:hypothetical protein